MQNKLILSIFSILLLSGCRYKDNDRFYLEPAKRRLGNNWFLKSAILVSNNRDLIKENPGLMNDSLKIVWAEKNKISLRTRYTRTWFPCRLLNNKTEIHYDPSWVISSLHLKITKLTHDELWMNGNPIGRIISRDTIDEVISFKYSTKP